MWTYVIYSVGPNLTEESKVLVLLFKICVRIIIVPKPLYTRMRHQDSFIVVS